MKGRPDRDQAHVRRLRSRLLASAYRVLAGAVRPIDDPVRVQVGDGIHDVAIVVGPPGAGCQLFPAAAPEDAYPGRHLSPFELRVWEALAGGPLLVKQLSAAIVQKTDSPRVKIIVANLLARGVLRHTTRGRGVERVPLPGSSAAHPRAKGATP